MKDTVVFGIICLLVSIIFLQRACTDITTVKPVADTITVVDTFYVTKDSLIFSKPKLIKVVVHQYLPAEYKPDTSYSGLLKQFDKLVSKHRIQNIYQDSLYIDSLGYVMLTDTVQFNELQNRSGYYSFKIPHIKETVTITEQAPAVRQVYVGGALNASKTFDAYNLQIGVLYKTKKDQLFGPTVSFNTSGQLMYGIQSYWKIKLKK
jgi:hypothetical protein